MTKQTHAAMRQPNPICSNVPSEANSIARQIDKALQILRMKQLIERTQLSRATLYSLMTSDPSFPRKIKLSERTVGYVESEVVAWICRALQHRSEEKMNIFTPTSAHTPQHSITRENRGEIINRFTPSLPQSSPFHCLPGLLGLMGRDLNAGDGVAAEIIGTELIAFASLLTQGVADVAWPNGQTISIGANAVLAAPSGTGKSLIFKILTNPIEEYLAALESNEETMHYDFLIEYSTREAIMQSMRDWPVSGLFTDEAGQLKGLLKDAPTLVKLLDGAPIRSACVSTGRVVLNGQRFSMLLMEQPEVFEATKLLLGTSKGGVGLINRFFVVFSDGSGARGSPHRVALSTDVEQAYKAKIHELLSASILHIKEKNHKRPILKLSSAASQLLVDIDRDTRRNCIEGSPWFFISEYISRHVERVLRLAGVFHVFENGVNGEISLDTLQRAEIIGNWYVESFARIVYEPPKQTQVETDADQLERSFFQVFQRTSRSQFLKSDLGHYALNIGLTPARVTRALAFLGEQGRVRIFMHLRKPWVELNTFRLPQY